MSDANARRPLRRHVFFVPGYDTMTVADHHRLFKRESARFGSVWGAETTSGEPAAAAPSPHNPQGGAWSFAVRGPDWASGGTFEILAWHDLAAADMARSFWSHAKGTARALLDMITSGTVVRYFLAQRRYAYFFVFTYVVLAGFLLAPLIGGKLAALWLAPATGWPLAILIGLLVAAGIAYALLRWPARRMRLKQSLDLAEFSVDFVRGRHPAIDARAATFAGRLREVEAAEAPPDEIVIACHSLGATLGMLALSRALDDPAFGARVPVRILTLGNTMAKFALHPAGTRLRAAAERVAAAEDEVKWLEIQSTDDLVSFYKVDPVTLKRCVFVGDDTPVGTYPTRPMVRHVPVWQMVSKGEYMRRRADLLRIHCQCFLASDIRAPFDFYAFVCGPASFDTVAACAEGLKPRLAEDGRLLP